MQIINRDINVESRLAYRCIMSWCNFALSSQKSLSKHTAKHW